MTLNPTNPWKLNCGTLATPWVIKLWQRAGSGGVKEQAIERCSNLVTDVIMGNNIKEGLKREKNNIKATAAEGI